MNDAALRAYLEREHVHAAAAFRLDEELGTHHGVSWADFVLLHALHVLRSAKFRAVHGCDSGFVQLRRTGAPLDPNVTRLAVCEHANANVNGSFSPVAQRTRRIFRDGRLHHRGRSKPGSGRRGKASSVRRLKEAGANARGDRANNPVAQPAGDCDTSRPAGHPRRSQRRQPLHSWCCGGNSREI